MPRQRSPARLWLRPAEDGRGAIWCIVDGRRRESTGCLAGETERAEAKLQAYIASKRNPAELPQRGAHETFIADVLSVYLDEVVNAGVDDNSAPSEQHKKATARIRRLTLWWGAKTLAEVNEKNCAAYLASRKDAAAEARPQSAKDPRAGKGRGAARRDLEDLRAAINHHAGRKLHTGTAEVVLPPRGKARTRYLTRDEVAKLLRVCWRHRREEIPPRGPRKGQRVESHGFYDLRHVARFILMGIYTGSRTAPILKASIYAASDRAYIDLDAGLYFRLPEDVDEPDNKRAPTCRMPPQIVGHIRRWTESGAIAQFVVEWQGLPIASIKTAWKRAVTLAKLTGNPTPHTLRHTCVTWLKQRGVSSFEVGAFVGMSERMVEHVYGHHDPDYQSQAAGAFGVRSRHPGHRAGKATR